MNQIPPHVRALLPPRPPKTPEPPLKVEPEDPDTLDPVELDPNELGLTDFW